MNKEKFIQIRVDEVFKAKIAKKAKRLDVKISELIVQLLQKWLDE